MKKTIFILMIGVFVLIGCQSTNIGYGVASPTNFTEVYLLEGMSLFSVTDPIPNNAARNWYFKNYASIIPNLKMSSGYYSSEGELLAAHLLEGEDTSKGTIIMIHGFNGTSLTSHFQYFAQQFIARGYRAILLDLPGHSFSGGRRGAIDNYKKYGDMVNNFLEFTKGTLGPEIVLMGHSVGSTSIYEAYIHHAETMKMVDAAVLLTPFSDLNHSEIYSFGTRFKQDIKTDNTTPMQLANFPTNWIRAEKEWAEKIQDYPVLENENMLIVFGDEDKVIKYSQSVVFFTEKISDAQIKIYEGQDHNLLNEGYKDFREETLDWALAEINYTE